MLDEADVPLTIGNLIVRMYRAAGHPEDVWCYEDVQRLGEADRYRTLILSMVRSGELVRTKSGSHYVTTAAQALRRVQTYFTVVALRSDPAPDEWIIVACLQDVAVHDDQWTLLPTEEDWSRYGDTFLAVSAEQAVEAALSAWTDDDEDSSEEPEVDIEGDAPMAPEDIAEAVRLSQLAESLHIDPTDLDEAVHEAAARYASDVCNATGTVDDEVAADEIYDEAGRQAADGVNNGSVYRQVSYLVAQYGADQTEEIIRGAAKPGAAGAAEAE
ncbi:hypothetical protein [Streptomyces sp. NBC_01601]|uniref:hypothetical protein n=1 Tax=Streptomyces sp. NBC_01601 TaxID=2975892 RepID=UPI002E2C0FC4|nr:hypothetical protein [Streptomyces sp. NBC_01601]